MYTGFYFPIVCCNLLICRGVTSKNKFQFDSSANTTHLFMYTWNYIFLLISTEH